MKLFFHKLLPALLSAGILTLSFPCSVRGAIASRDWKRGYTGSFTLAWDPLVPGTSHNAVFMMEQGSKVYLGDLATTGICGLSARQLQKESYESASPRYVSVSKITGLVQGKKPGASLVKLQAADQTITAMITVVPKGTCGLTAEGRKLNTTLFQYGKSFSGKISPSSAIRWYQKAAKAENTLENLSSQQVNPLGFHSSGLLVFPGASSARALTNTLTTYRDNSHPLRRDSCCSFLPESLCANVKKNRLTLRLNSSVTKQQLLGLMTDPLAGGSQDATRVSDRKTWQFTVLVYDKNQVNSFGEGRAYPAQITAKCGSRMMSIQLKDPKAKLIKGHTYILSDPRLSEAEAQGGWTAGASSTAK